MELTKTIIMSLKNYAKLCDHLEVSSLLVISGHRVVVSGDTECDEHLIFRDDKDNVVGEILEK